jgi:hypothetical protein
MAACEKCWGDAFTAAVHRGGSQVDRYRELLAERKDTPCTPEQQRGPGHEAPQCGRRLLVSGHILPLVYDHVFPETTPGTTCACGAWAITPGTGSPSIVVGPTGMTRPGLAEREAWRVLEAMELAEVPCVGGDPHVWVDATGATTRRYVCERCPAIREAAGSL